MKVLLMLLKSLERYNPSSVLSVAELTAIIQSCINKINEDELKIFEELSRLNDNQF